MELGGAETSLIGLLDALDPELVDVDLFIHSHQGPLMKYIPDWVNILHQKGTYSVIERPISEAIRKGQLGVVTGRVISKIRHRLYRKSLSAQEVRMDASELQYVASSVSPFLPKINSRTDYDLCISYMAPHNFALRKVRAKRRLAWIHTDYSTIHVNVAHELPIWDGFDYIASISPHVTDAFLSIFPSLANKIIEIENIMPISMIKKRSEEFTVEKEIPVNNGHNLLSVGRFCTAKNYDNVPDIARRIIDQGIDDLKWYLIGYGIDEQLIRQRIAEAGMQEHVIILGKKENPYPYIKACDIYVQPSRYEGKSITVREAQLLGKPVAVTNYPTASSQITDGVDGKIVPLDNEGCAMSLYGFINNKSQQEIITKNLSTRDLASLRETAKIYKLLSNKGDT